MWPKRGFPQIFLKIFLKNQKIQIKMDLDAKNQKNSRFGFQEDKDLVIPGSKRKSSS